MTYDINKDEKTQNEKTSPASVRGTRNEIPQIAYFEKNPLERTAHPVFGLLTYEDWLVLHHKHAIHHLNQFRL